MTKRIIVSIKISILTLWTAQIKECRGNTNVVSDLELIPPFPYIITISWLVNLLLRFHDLESGKIVIDGQDISQVTQDSLRAAIGMVTQDTSLLHRSVRENIVYGKPDATDAELLLACKHAEANVFIDDLEDPKGNRGYMAQVGERGVKLSGGQRQRIAIARVLLKNAPITVHSSSL